MSADAQSDTLLVFARNPVAGRVKTRLIGTLTAQQAADVYVELLQHTLDVASDTGAGSIRVYIDDDEPNPALQRMLNHHGLPWHRQQGRDLGARMLRAISDALRSASRAVLIGTDCPEFDPDYLARAFAALSSNDAVIGPAADGGYVLIGMKDSLTGLFSDIPWGSSEVLEMTRQRLSRLKLDWSELPTLHDVDDIDDLARFPQLAASVLPPGQSGTACGDASG